MKILKVGEPDFEKLRRENVVYVDKTELIHRMWVPGGYFFLSRPRRFGKSLTVSTLKALALGKKELFESLWIYDKVDNWEAHPVVHLSFSSVSNGPGKLLPSLLRQLDKIAHEYGFTLSETNLNEKFQELIETLSKRNPVVLLIDEYDKPLTDYFDNLPQAYENQKILREFYAPLKDLTGHIRLIFITGISKFSKMSLFSTLNNLADLTLDEQYGTLCGYTDAELTQHFDPYFRKLAEKLDISYEALRAEIKRNYNGYNWLGENVYNPWSVINCCYTQRISNYWFTSGNPYFLIQKLREANQYDLNDLTLTDAFMNSYELEELDFKNLLFQTGYMTIESYNWREREYTLRYPNLEVEESLYQHLSGAYTHSSPANGAPTAKELAQILKKRDLSAFEARINALFATIPDNMFFARYEGYYQAVMHVTFHNMGFLTQSEVRQAKGRPDIIVVFPDRVYILEFKLHDTAEAVLQQIKDKDYAAPYRGSGREIILIGIQFGKTEKGIKKMVHEVA